MTGLELKLHQLPGPVSCRYSPQFFGYINAEMVTWYFRDFSIHCFTYTILSGGVLASTWVLKQREHTGAHVDLFKNVHLLVANNDYQLAA